MEQMEAILRQALIKQDVRISDAEWRSVEVVNPGIEQKAETIVTHRATFASQQGLRSMVLLKVTLRFK